MDESGGLESVIGAFSSKITGRKLPEFIINCWERSIDCRISAWTGDKTVKTGESRSVRSRHAVISFSFHVKTLVRAVLLSSPHNFSEIT